MYINYEYFEMFEDSLVYQHTLYVNVSNIFFYIKNITNISKFGVITYKSKRHNRWVSLEYTDIYEISKMSNDLSKVTFTIQNSKVVDETHIRNLKINILL